MLKIMNCWLILYKFGYNKKLSLNESLFQDELVNFKAGSSVELKEEAILFLRKIFWVYSTNEKTLNELDLERTFFSCPKLPKEELKQYSPCDFSKGMSEPDWQCFWRYLNLFI